MDPPDGHCDYCWCESCADDDDCIWDDDDDAGCCDDECCDDDDDIWNEDCELAREDRERSPAAWLPRALGPSRFADWRRLVIRVPPGPREHYKNTCFVIQSPKETGLY